MTLEEKVGQIFMVAPEAVDKDGGSTTVFTENIEKEIEKYNLGGYILFASNIENPTQTQELINGLKNLLKFSLLWVLMRKVAELLELVKIQLWVWKK